jgi:acetylornithine deacetylase
LLVDQPLFTEVNAPFVQLASQVLVAMGYSGEPHAVPFGSDASKLSAIGVSTILFGPGSIDQAHAADEFVETVQVEQAVQFYRRCIESFGADISSKPS